LLRCFGSRRKACPYERGWNHRFTSSVGQPVLWTRLQVQQRQMYMRSRSFWLLIRSQLGLPKHWCYVWGTDLLNLKWLLRLLVNGLRARSMKWFPRSWLQFSSIWGRGSHSTQNRQPSSKWLRFHIVSN
jgi:hypothetical protein